uniref:Dynamin-1-like protein n=1 Tax=Bursaphelenchus xylophilus TaxID=6326 RepID=A0A1I7S230_BURXY
MKDNSKPSGKGMDRLIQLVSKLQDVFSTVDAASQEMQLPQIVVVGDQSAGKSSLLERIVRRDFLPRGTGIVTRQPLVLDLIRTPIGDRRRKRPGAPAEGDFALFEGVEKVYTDFEEVREGIEELTRKTCGSNKGVSDKRIHLRIYSEHVVDLSLVDLPGLTRVAVGDQPEDIPEQIRGMIETFIANENTIILAVTPANVDLATSEPLKLAKQFDPKGDRTIAVLTKLDLMDKGTSAEHVLLGHTIPVKLGIVGVVNRSQQDLNNNKSLDAMEDDEIAFFKKKYPHLAADTGTKSKPSEKGMDRLIQLVSKLQDVFSTVDAASQEMQLPQIVVVGDQSAGKSSLLERIVRRDFLPRGTGIVTRQPLVLDLIRTPIGDRRRKRPGAPAEGDFALFEGVEKIYTDFDEVREGVEELTRKTCGSNKGVSDKRIHLRIYSEHVVDLSLVDLPGLTRVAVGDQPEDIPEQIRGMIETFIANENTIILAVTPANVDLATSEPLKLAKQFDPKGDRTIAVLTKLDLMDKGTSAEHVLLGHTIPVKLGIVGVVNRSQQDLNNNKSLDAMEDDEIAFFKKKYPHLAAVNGSNYLAQRLNEILIGHIKRCLPALVVRIHDKTAEKKRKLIELGESFSDPNNAVVKTVTQFTQTFNALSFDGCAVMDKEDRSPAAKISSIFHDDFPDEIDQLNPLEGVRRDDVDAFLRNATVR